MHSKLYIKLMNSKRWKQLRVQQLTEHPLCERCQRMGYVRAASVVHHIREVESGINEEECQMLAFNPGNLQSLCRECHAEIHNDRRSHTREAHHQREQERLARWVERLEKNQ